MPHARPKARPLFSSVIAVILVCSGPATAQSADRVSEPVASAAQSPFIGDWELDLSRMPENYGPPPKMVTFTFEDVGSGMWRTRVEITAQDDSVRRAAIQYRRDGRAVRGEGDQMEGDSAALSSPAPNVLVMSMAKDNGLSGVRVYSVSVDGREMTESAASVDNTGAPFVRNFHFRRIR